MISSLASAKTCGDYIEFNNGKMDYRMDVFDYECDGTIDAMNIRFNGYNYKMVSIPETNITKNWKIGDIVKIEKIK